MRSSARGLDAFDRLVNFLLPKVRLGHDPGDGPPMTRDNDGLPALDVIEQLGEMRFGCDFRFNPATVPI